VHRLRRRGPRYGHHAQNDRWIAEVVFPGLRGGFFVEAGACKGLAGSATLALERDLGWSGICVEPLPAYYELLVRHRDCRTDDRCLAARSGEEIRFLSYVEDRARSGIEALNSNGTWAARHNATSETLTVASVTLADLLADHEAPEPVCYLCLDIEGGERTVLEAFDFSAHRVLAISVEGSRCDDLLTGEGYRRVDNPFAPNDVDHYFLHGSI